MAPAERQKLLGLQPLTFTAGKAADVAAVANVLCGDKASVLGRACTAATSGRLRWRCARQISTLTVPGGSLAEALRAAQRDLARRRTKVEQVFRDPKIR